MAAGLAERCDDPARLRHRRRRAAVDLCRYRTAPATVAEAKLEKRARRGDGPARPRGIRKHLDLNRPIYARTAAYGHFGRKPDADGGFSWEKTDVEAERAERKRCDGCSPIRFKVNQRRTASEALALPLTPAHPRRACKGRGSAQRSTSGTPSRTEIAS
ncbi:MAG: methionine adenosyltransferase domain-containing protein [Rhodopseudomonas palustris]|nr:methionine adenosyltransferase domain-containing protein [Rhodopseudomonas palustris]